MAHYQVKPVLNTVDPVWVRVRREAEEVVKGEPELATFIYSTILHHDTLEAAIVYRLSERLGPAALSGELIRQAYKDALEDTPSIGESFRADIVATLDRDPATHRLLEPCSTSRASTPSRRIGWRIGCGTRAARDFALYLQSRSSAVFQTDINPAVPIGKGIFLDHATGLVVGDTAVIEDDVSILQDVTLGGTGKEAGDRHPRSATACSSAPAPRSSAISRSAIARHRRRLGRAASGAAQLDRRRRAGAGRRRGRAVRAVAHHGPDALWRHARRLSALARRGSPGLRLPQDEGAAVNVQEIRQLDAWSASSRLPPDAYHASSRAAAAVARGVPVPARENLADDRPHAHEHAGPGLPRRSSRRRRSQACASSSSGCLPRAGRRAAPGPTSTRRRHPHTRAPACCSS